MMVKSFRQLHSLENGILLILFTIDVTNYTEPKNKYNKEAC